MSVLEFPSKVGSINPIRIHFLEPRNKPALIVKEHN
ncbi:MAG: hypothetical protein ACJART_002629, partial [Maribacter sp.]